MKKVDLEHIIDYGSCPLLDAKFTNQCFEVLSREGALVLKNFLTSKTIINLVEEAKNNQHKAYYSDSTHNIYLTPRDNSLSDDHIFNLQIKSSKGCITTDQIPDTSALKAIYSSEVFKNFIAAVVGEKTLYEYEDPLSSINIHYAKEGQELGWHFDNSSFAVTLLLQKPLGGGVFEYVKNVRNSESGDMGFDKAKEIVMGNLKPSILDLDPGTLVLFKGKDSMHRVTPTVGEVTRYLVVFAYNSKPGVSLSKSAQKTFYGRVS